jgi:hypothetical protein
MLATTIYLLAILLTKKTWTDGYLRYVKQYTIKDPFAKTKIIFSSLSHIWGIFRLTCDTDAY